MSDAFTLRGRREKTRIELTVFLTAADLAKLDAIADANLRVRDDIATFLLKRGLDSVTPAEMEPHKFRDGWKVSR